MNFAPRLAVFALPLLLLAGPAAAAEGSKPNQAAREAEIRTGLACDTQQQVERFISLYDGDTHDAVKKVNDAEGDPTACVVAQMAYVRGRPLAKARHNNTTFQIVPILVLGLVTDAGVESVAPSTLFSAIEIDEIEI